MDRITCSGCDNTWTGLNKCHCSTCHRTFGGIVGFDMHRRDSKCVDPATLNLEEKKGIWIQTSHRDFSKMSK